MKISRAIELANLVEQGNVLPQELAIAFLSELDGMIQTDIMLLAPEEVVEYTGPEQELLLKPPHDKLYIHYLVMMIRQCQQEFEGYNNAQEAVDGKLKAFRRWYVSHYRPADTRSRSYPGSAGAYGMAYISAYGIAVKLGFTGTEEKWLESLKGDPGEPARMRYDAERGMIQWGAGDAWEDLFTLQELRDPAVAAFLAEAAGYRDQAQTSADTATDAAENAQSYAGAAGKSAEYAAGSAREASTSAQEAAKSRGEAVEAAGAAAGSADDAQTQAETAGNYAKAAEEAARRAEEALGSGGGSTGDINDAIDSHNTDLAAHAAMQDNLNGLRDKAISEAIGSHSTDSATHADIRTSLESLRNRVSILLNSDDVTLDQTKEIVAYIKSNKSLIDAVTASKVSVADIVDNLVTLAHDKPLSAAMGVSLAGEINSLRASMPKKVSQLQNDKGYLTEHQDISHLLPREELPEAVEDALAQAKASGEFDGEDGRGIKSIARTSGNGAAGTVDTYTITYTDGTTGTYQVRNGANGSNGITPTIGANGNWFSGDTDTGVQATGPQGEAGVSGVYILDDGESLEDAPEDADVVIDPGGAPTMETWVFTLADGTTVEKQVYVYAV